jgi:hypothetical protein
MDVRRPAALLLLLLLGLAAPAAAAPPTGAVETDDEALADVRKAVQARDAEALLKRVGGAGVEGGTDRLVSPGWIKKYLTAPTSEVKDWVFGPKAAPPPGQPAPWSMAACLAAKVEVRRVAAEAVEVRCSRGDRQATFGMERHQGKWAITRDFFWPNELVN